MDVSVWRGLRGKCCELDVRCATGGLGCWEWQFKIRGVVYASGLADSKTAAKRLAQNAYEVWCEGGGDPYV